jgi:hypothetical protein
LVQVQLNAQSKSPHYHHLTPFPQPLSNNVDIPKRIVFCNNDKCKNPQRLTQNYKTTNKSFCCSCKYTKYDEKYAKHEVLWYYPRSGYIYPSSYPVITSGGKKLNQK